jgi:N utilization substance protein B
MSTHNVQRHGSGLSMSRRKSREYALQLLFQTDFIGREPDSSDFREFWSDKNEQEPIRRFTEDIVKGTISQISELDTVIEKITKNWLLQRMAAVDRNILRLAAYEILHRDDIPSAVTINEALEVAKKFSSQDSVAFINGVLDRLAKDTGKA